MKTLKETAPSEPDRSPGSERVPTPSEEWKVIVDPADIEPPWVQRTKPPRVPFYDDDEAARRRRLEPTAHIPRQPTSVAVPTPAMPAMTDDAAASGGARKRGGFGVFLIVAALGAVGLAVAMLARWHGLRDDAPRSRPTRIAASAPPPLSDEPPVAPVTTTTASAAAPEETVLNIETIPAHAVVFLAGARMGTSPLELKVPKSDEPLRLELRHPGYLPFKDQVVPNVNQRLRLTLMAGRGAPLPPPSGSANPYRKFE